MIPHLKKQIDRKLLNDHLELLKGMTKNNYFETRKWLDLNRSYLSQPQCDIVNQELSRIYKEIDEEGAIVYKTPFFKPDLGMNDSYFMGYEPRSD